MPKFKDYYAVLGVPPRCHHRVIEERYWEQAHGLKGDPTKKAQKRLSLINEAYETLGSPHRREQYDRLHAEYRTPSNGHGASRPTFMQNMLDLLGKPFRPD